MTVEADGDFTYQPATGTSCTDTSDFFDYTVSDGGASPLTDIGRVTITISNCVWYVRNDAAPGLNGSSVAPFDTLEEADVASGANQTIFVYRGNGTTTGLTTTFDFANAQRLVGEAVALVVDGTTLVAAGNRPSLAGNLSLASGDTVTGIAMAGNAVPAIGAGRRRRQRHDRRRHRHRQPRRHLAAGQLRDVEHQRRLDLDHRSELRRPPGDDRRNRQPPRRRDDLDHRVGRARPWPSTARPRAARSTASP